MRHKNASPKNSLHRRVALVFAAVFLCAALVLFPARALADAPAIHSIDIHIQLHPDGSASFTEVWDVSIVQGTEYYVNKYYMQGRTIQDFSVTDENGTLFADQGAWNSDRDREEKAYQSGLIEINDGYELCWGFGEYGDHTYTLRYTMTELVRSYHEADGIYQTLIPDGLDAGVQRASVTIEGDGMQFVASDNTLVWPFGTDGHTDFTDGTVVITSDGAMTTREYLSVVVRFEQGLFQPVGSVDRDFSDMLNEAMEGSPYETGGGTSGGYDDEYSGGGSYYDWEPIFLFGIVILCGGGTAAVLGTTLHKRSVTSRKNAQEYNEAPYCRKLPYGGSLPASYARLDEVGMMKNEGLLIGAYILRWLRKAQIQIVPMPGSRAGSDKTALQMFGARPGMDSLESQLYAMLLEASGGDFVLGDKEFKKWSKKHYSRVSGWMEQFKNSGSAAIRQMGGIQDVPTTHFFGLVHSTKSEVSPLGTQLTIEMYGFKKYLQDFTIINERQPVEVQLWDDYLVFAQLFGIADTVAGQFKALYPDYFRPPAESDYGYGHGVDFWDIYWITRMANSYGRAMSTGFHEGLSAAQVSSGSGGGFSGGGGGFSGGGSGSGGGAR